VCVCVCVCVYAYVFVLFVSFILKTVSISYSILGDT
jgi:hypothetical protein